MTAYPDEGNAYYEERSTLDEYLALHYPDGDPLERLLGDRAPGLYARFPYAVHTLCDPRPDGLALDVGAACGRVTFDLARSHRAAIGLDLSHRLIAGAREVQRTGRARYRTVDEGELLDTFDVEVEAPDNASFLVGNALALPFVDGVFATVVALNLIDRVPDPARALDELARVVAPGGALIVGSPYTWLESFTARDRWLGGFERDGWPVRGRDTVRAHLERTLSFAEETTMPFYIGHHARSGQLGIAHIQMFRRASAR